MYQLVQIEDDVKVRLSIGQLFADSTKFELAFETDDIYRAISFYRNKPAPHLVLLDLNLPGLSGIDGLPLLRRHFPNTEIVVFTILEDDDKIFQAICNGASGYLLKTTPYQDLEKHLLSTVEGRGSVLSPSIARRVLSYFNPGARKNTGNNKEEALTDTEQTIVRLLVDALTYQAIADKLGMSIDGIRYYVKRIYAKLQVRSRHELATKYLKGN